MIYKSTSQTHILTHTHKHEQMESREIEGAPQTTKAFDNKLQPNGFRSL